MLNFYSRFCNETWCHCHILMLPQSVYRTRNQQHQLADITNQSQHWHIYKLFSTFRILFPIPLPPTSLCLNRTMSLPVLLYLIKTCLTSYIKGISGSVETYFWSLGSSPITGTDKVLQQRNNHCVLVTRKGGIILWSCNNIGCIM